ncbi:hypothetical protein RSK20926_06422 [Roseobacter sp. SK209-2-6]|nr:hypothetical protein RSK20926_06422 [Roseobacter sp. SK209-2-6]
MGAQERAAASITFAKIFPPEAAAEGPQNNKSPAAWPGFVCETNHLLI